MKFFDSVFNAFLSRDQRDRVSQSNWNKSVAAAARDMAPPTPPSTPELPASHPMTPSLSRSSTSSTHSRPTTSYSTSPRPEFRRHLSIQREPISYDSLITSTEPPKAARRSSQDTAPSGHQLLYPLPPLGPMEGIGKYRRSVDITEAEYVNVLERNTIAALRPVVMENDRVGRFRRDTTTPPRGYSVSPDMEQRQEMMKRMNEELTEELEVLVEAQLVQPILEDVCEVVEEKEVVRSTGRPAVRVARKKAAGTKGRNGAAKKPVGAARVRGGNKAAYKQRVKKEVEMSASMETLVSGEE
ncbi:hypothetical protein BZA77DRAFT_350301 [Pyronema omphalodes]|nr:hypothetical protein BZA77DRAFT_350301 [Pyronema omphalodes]